MIFYLYYENRVFLNNPLGMLYSIITYNYIYFLFDAFYCLLFNLIGNFDPFISIFGKYLANGRNYHWFLALKMKATLSHDLKIFFLNDRQKL